MTEVEKIRAEIEAAKKVAMANFEATWGTRDVQKVARAVVAAGHEGHDPSTSAAVAQKRLRRSK